VKHGGTHRDPVERVLAWLGERSSLRDDQWDQLEAFVEWLNQEALAAGGIGPHESDRIWSRHIADSIAYACAWLHTDPPPRLLDVGSGVGLPGIPLAILWPGTRVTLLDRSGRRVDLARRAARRLGLTNVDVRQGDAVSESADWEAVVFRAVFPPERACRVAGRLLGEGGSAVIGLRGRDAYRMASWSLPETPPVRVVDIPATVLDGTVSLLIMGPSEH
jgi:16S rRNA (guanine527-N7)-methyltransferase